MGKVFKDRPLAEITLRKFERPVAEHKDEIIRKFCISIGLLQPGDSRDVIVDIFKLLINARRERKILTSKEIDDKIKTMRDKGVAPSNIRRQLLRLERMNIIEKKDGGYRLREFMSLAEILEDINKFLIEPMYNRIKEYAELID